MAIRMARRDARRYKWRSALIVAMVGLPVLVLTCGITLVATKDVSVAESVPRVMGAAQARIEVNGADGSGSNGTVARVRGFPLDSEWTTEKVQWVTGGRVIQTLAPYVRVNLGDRRPRMPILGIDGRDPLARGMAELVSGRWATTSSEIVVTEAGVADGLPRAGALTATGRNGRPRLMTVVGVASAHPATELPRLVALPDLARDLSVNEPELPAFLVERADPVTWPDVRRMDGYGLVVQSREVLLNPPPEVGPDSPAAQSSGSGQSGFDPLLLLAAVGLFLEATLLAGPAFAVSAARQRRSLALVASNGAETRQLRRYVLGQAVVLGILSAAGAVVGGVLLARAGLTWWQAGHADFVTGPFDISWPLVAGVFLCAVVASLVSAVLPARGISRLDIVFVLSGRAGDRPVHRGLPAAGGVVMVLSGIALIWSVAASGGGALGTKGYVLVIGAVGTIGLVLGCLMVIPALLALVGRLGSYLVLPLRLAARDTARQRGRSTPAVAAIMAAVAALTAISVGAASDIRHSEDAYLPSGPMGSGTISFMYGKDSDEAGARRVIHRFAPQLEVDPVGHVEADDHALNGDPHTVSWVALLPRGCSEAQILAALKPLQGVGSCESPAGSYAASYVRVGSLSQLSALSLSKSQRTLLEKGGMLVTDPRSVQDGQVSFVGGSLTRDRSGTTTRAALTERTRVPAAVVDLRRVKSQPSEATLAWILPKTATRLGWPVRTTALNLSSPTGAISPQVERAVADRLGDDSSLYVERGYRNESSMILLILFSVTGLLVLIASLISTALSLAESQSDMATLAAVGATRHTRRGIAACQAFVVAACGALLGVGVGMIPGIATAWLLTVSSLSAPEAQLAAQSPTIVIPWLPSLGVVLLVPMVAAGLAWVAVRRHPQMTRRLV